MYYKYWKEFQEFVKWKRSETKEPNESNVEFLTRAIGFDDDRDDQRSTNRAIQDLPPEDQTALVARYVVNQAGNRLLVSLTRENLDVKI